MNKKRNWFAIPIALLPYFALFTLATIFFSTKTPFFEWIMVSIFQSNGINLLIALLIYCMITIVLSIILFVASIRREWAPLLLAKNAIIVKLIQIPAYTLIFVLGILLAITIFTIPFSVGLFVFDCLTLCLTGLLTAAAVVNAVHQGDFKIKEVIWILVLQLVFCADVISSIVFYLKLKKIKNQKRKCDFVSDL